ncbi:MAG: glycosyltransferase [Verrucomicrobia bacterium]|nr:glycosyltransferase [Verrucomicrobiota bacterium]
MELTIVIPAYNEEAVIEETLRDIEKRLPIPHQIIVVNDHSRDDTAGIVERLATEFPHIRLIHNTGERGICRTLQTGWHAATTPVVVTMMADLCDDPATVPAMLEKIEAGFDVCCGSRYMPGGRKIGGPALQSWFSRFVGWSLAKYVGLPTCDASNAFKMYRREVLTHMTIEDAGFASSLEIIVKAFLKNYKICEVPTTWRTRTKGKSSFKIFKVARNYLRWYVWALLFRKHRF